MTKRSRCEIDIFNYARKYNLSIDQLIEGVDSFALGDKPLYYQKIWKLRLAPCLFPENPPTYSLAEVGMHFGITAERVRQIMHRLYRACKRKHEILPDKAHIKSLELPGSIQNALLAEEIYKIEKLSSMSDEELLNIPNIGKLSLQTIKNKVAHLK